MQQTRALIVVAEARGRTMRTARSLGGCLRRRGHIVHVGDALSASPPAPTDYAAVIFGAEVGRARQRRALGAYIARHRDNLDRTATMLFLLGRARDGIASRGCVDAFESAVSWRPDFTAALPHDRTAYVRMLLTRMLVSSLRRLMGAVDGSETDDVADLANAIDREVRRHAFTT